MENHLISREMLKLLKEDKFEEFIVSRTKLIYQQIIKLTTMNY